VAPGYDELGAEVPLHAVIGESNDAIVVLQSATVYVHGMTLHVAARAKRRPVLPNPLDDDDEDARDSFAYHDRRSPKYVRFGVEFSDGRKITNLQEEPHWWDRQAGEPAGLVLLGHPDGGGYVPLPSTSTIGSGRCRRREPFAS
jgi:hypothetical protein